MVDFIRKKQSRPCGNENQNYTNHTQTRPQTSDLRKDIIQQYFFRKTGQNRLGKQRESSQNQFATNADQPKPNAENQSPPDQNQIENIESPERLEKEPTEEAGQVHRPQAIVARFSRLAPHSKARGNSNGTRQANRLLADELESKDGVRMSTDKKQVRILKSDNFSFGKNQLRKWALGSEHSKMNLSAKPAPNKPAPRISDIVQSMRRNDHALDRLDAGDSMRRGQFEKTVDQLPVIESFAKPSQKSSELHEKLQEVGLGQGVGVGVEVADLHIEEFQNDSRKKASQVRLQVPKNSSLKSARPVSIFGEDDLTDFSSRFTGDKK